MNGDLVALLATLCWSVAAVTIARGAGGKGEDNGAFLAILMTAAISGVIWLGYALRLGWPRLNAEAMLWFALGGALTIYIGRVFLHSSIQYLGAVRASSVKRMQPLFAVILGVTILDEPLGIPLLVGMLLIFSGFGVLVRESMATRDSGASVTRIDDRSGLGRWLNLGIVFGAVSALAYAAGNVTRKLGLEHMPDAAFGTMFGAVVGAILFVLTALFVQSYRKAMHSTFTRFNPWLFISGIMSSAGQLLFFVAIDLSSVSRASLIASTEVFLTMLLMGVLFRGREQLTLAILIAATLGVLGTAVIILN